ncbi:Fe-S cluster assembly protein SufD [Tumidithrix elongata RA019]|uniref:Fe-S cluster assembly protein SufD n=1 Tax=Tumidithrix elongata BACA0141 TaxID=2716417 RepID=A0AAW9Q6Q3_9CYAN|nr:Fe-S cluster assembly protein SufD [Tumidithrix elongata RA019]
MTIQVSDQISNGQPLSQFAAIADRSKFANQILALYKPETSAPDTLTNKYLAEVQQEVSTNLATLNFPTTKDEEWKFTDISALAKLALTRPASDRTADLAIAQAIEKASIPEATENLITFINGAFSSQYSHIQNLGDSFQDASRRIVVGTLGTIGDDIAPILRSHLAKHPDIQDFFATLNTACLSGLAKDVAVVLIPKGVSIEAPIQLLFVSADGGIISQPRCLVVAEAHSKVTLVETYVGMDSQPYFTNTVTEIWLAESAQVHHTKVQQEGNEAFWVANTAIAQSRHSVYQGNTISLGAKLSRHNLYARQMGEQTETHLNGLAFMDSQRLADTHSSMSHDYPHGSSNQLHKCIAGDRGHAVFNGKIQVAKPAQLTDSRQLSRNLLLSAKARIDTKPQLEIFADNVKCAHGATVSQLDAEEVFYLQSRGIDAASSASLLTYAFAAEVINQIAIASLRESLSAFVLEHLG